MLVNMWFEVKWKKEGKFCTPL